MKKTGKDLDDVLTLGGAQAEPLTYHFNRQLAILLWAVIFVTIVVFLGRVYYLSIISHQHYASIAFGNTEYDVPIIAPRGKIYSMDGATLADNEPNYRAVISANNALQEQTADDIASLATMLDMDRNDVAEIVSQVVETKTDRVLKEHLAHEDVLAVEVATKKYPFLRLEKNARRVYPDGPFFAHVIGYEGLIRQEEHEQRPDYLLTDRIGKTGIELTYEDVLHGTHGAERTLRDSRGKMTRTLPKKRVRPGSDLVLNIDAELQKAITIALQKQLDRADTRRASAVALDPRTGAIRALVSLPGYDNNAFAQGIAQTQYQQWITDDNRPLFNRTIAGAYPPGSTVKPEIAVAALEEHVISPEHQIESRGGLQYGRFFFGDWRAHGFTDMRRAIAVSSDVYFYTVGGGYGPVKGLGIERLHRWYERFGYGQKTGIDLPGEVAGFNPDAQWKKDHKGEPWYIGDTYHSSIGQGFMTATPLQVANAIATIANGGTRYRPYIVQKTLAPDGREHVVAPQILQEHIASPQNIRIAQEGMRMTITDGTARMLNNLPVAVAGKTGTAEVGRDGRVHSWFVSYAPYENPEIVLLVMVENQTTDISSATVPVARDVYEWYYGGRDDQIINLHEHASDA